MRQKKYSSPLPSCVEKKGVCVYVCVCARLSKSASFTCGLGSTEDGHDVGDRQGDWRRLLILTPPSGSKAQAMFTSFGEG